MITNRSYKISGIEVQPGTKIRHFGNHDKLAFDLYSVCDSLSPEAWHGEARFAGRLLLSTEQAATHGGAGRLAEDALIERVVGIFGHC